MRSISRLDLGWAGLGFELCLTGIKDDDNSVVFHPRREHGLAWENGALGHWGRLVGWLSQPRTVFHTQSDGLSLSCCVWFISLSNGFWVVLQFFPCCISEYTISTPCTSSPRFILVKPLLIHLHLLLNVLISSPTMPPSLPRAHSKSPSRPSY